MLVDQAYFGDWPYASVKEKRDTNLLRRDVMKSPYDFKKNSTYVNTTFLPGDDQNVLNLAYGRT